MKKLILLLLCFSLKIIISQNGFTSYTTTLPSGANPSNQTCIFVDNAGNTWVGFMNGATNSAAAFGVYKKLSNTWTIYNKTNTPIIPINRVNCFEEDNLGNIWIGTGLGLLKFDGSNFTLYNTSNGLPANFIYSLEYSNNMLYIGTSGGGLSRYDGTTFTNYNPGNSLFPLNSISCIKAENANTLWAVFNNNLVKFYINSSFTSTSYTLASTSSTNHSFSSIHIDSSGELWLNSLYGLVKYNNTGFTYFESMYPDYTGGDFNGGNIVKGPNNGVMLAVKTDYPAGYSFLVEFLSGGKYNFYYPEVNLNTRLYICNDASGNTWITKSITTTTLALTTGIVEYKYSNYSKQKAFGLGASGGVNSDNFKYLDVNRVKAAIMNRGDMHWDIGSSGNSSYEVPKGSLTHSNFASSIWMGGLDASNQLHMAAQVYRLKGSDFAPGPLDTTTAFIDTTTALNYDKIWKVSYTDINNFITQYNLGNVPLSYTPTPDIVSWPAHGTGAKSRNLAPFVDVNGDGIYNWQQGDYPKIKGDQALYFIFNDNLWPHGETGGLPFGVEIHGMAYAYGCNKVLNGRNELAYTTFYDYKIYNRSNNNYHDVNFGYYSALDLGCYIDDYIASSPQNNLGFCYNSDADDSNCSGANGYGLYPPAFGNTVLKGPLADLGDLIDNDNDSIIDEPGEECLMNVFNYYNNNSSFFQASTQEPSTTYQYNNFLQGKWRDSTNFTCGGNAYGGTIPTKFVYPWSNYQNNLCGSWSEVSGGNLPGDRRFILASGPFNLPAKGMTEVEYALVWSVDSSATTNQNIASANKLISDVQKIRSFYKGTIPSCISSINIGVNETEDLSPLITVYPNPSTSYIKINSEVMAGKSVIDITDVSGRTILSHKNDDLDQVLINTSQLNAGIYFITIKFDNSKSVVKKIIKQ